MTKKRETSLTRRVGGATHKQKWEAKPLSLKKKLLNIPVRNANNGMKCDFSELS